MTPSAPTANWLPRHVTWEVKKLRSQTQHINTSRTGSSHTFRNTSRSRIPANPVEAAIAIRISNATPP